MLEEFEGAPHCRDAYLYACHVVKGHRPACAEEKQACQRFIDDLEKEAFEFTFDLGQAEKVCRFIERLPHTKGKWAAKRQNIKLEPWQCFCIVNLFGWLDEQGLRRFREVYWKIPRKNGKSLLAAAIALVCFVLDREYGAEIYSGATTEKQAWEVFRPAKIMCQRTPDLCDHFGIQVNAKHLITLSDASRFEPLIGNPGDGSSPHCAIVDEYHEHDTDDLVETMETGMGAREQPMLLKITTAGSNRGGPCYMAELEYKKLLQGVFQDDRIFVVLYGIDKEDDWTTEEALIKANPNYGVSVSAEFLRGQQAAAIRNPLKQNPFQRKHLNKWVGAHTAWLNMEAWKACESVIAIEDFHGEECVFPIDLASRIDIVAFLQVFSRVIAGKQHYYAFCRFYLPEETILDEEQPNHQLYQGWVNQGYLTATDGDEIDFNEIQADIVSEMKKTPVNEVVYDPWRATQLAQGLANEGAETVEFRCNKQNFSPAMYELEAAIASKRFHHDGNPVLNWMASNVVAKTDANDNIFPRKEKPENKIDGMVALIMAVGRLMHSEIEPDIPEDYEVMTV